MIATGLALLVATAPAFAATPASDENPAPPTSATSTAAPPGAAGKAQPVLRYAVVVGHNQAVDAGQARLEFADDDAARFFELFGAAGQAYLLTEFDDESRENFRALDSRALAPTIDNLRTIAAKVRRAAKSARAAGRQFELTFYYAGHGGRTEPGGDGRTEGYLALRDYRLERTEFRALFIDQHPASRIHVIVDACRSFHMAVGRGPGGRRVPVRSGFATKRAEPRVGYVLSTTGDRDSHEWSAIPGGVFSHLVRSALLGGGGRRRERGCRLR